MDQWIDSPVILLGRGGSGTRLMSELLAKNGLFLGNRINKFGDSVEWVDIIYEITRSTTLQRPATFELEWQQRLRDTAREILTKSGLPTFTAWGWKLPETILALPEVLHAFPLCKIIHLVRDPVSSSLRRSHLTSRSCNPIGEIVLKKSYMEANMSTDRIQEDDDHIRNAVTWLYQVKYAKETISNNLDEERCIEIKFEDFCSNIESISSQVGAFLKIDINPNVIEVDTNRLPPDLSSDPRVSEVTEICGDFAATFDW